jgi:chromosome transmission fidelity protein 1
VYLATATTATSMATTGAPLDFHHPFTPYDIQLQFMQALYGCLEDGKVAVFESPTGMR